MCDLIEADPLLIPATPSWFETSSLASLPLPVSLPTANTDEVSRPAAGLSRLRPLSAHVVPTLTKPIKRCSEGPPVKTAKRSASPFSPPEKRTRLEDSASDQMSPSVTLGKDISEVETINRIRPLDISGLSASVYPRRPSTDRDDHVLLQEPFVTDPTNMGDSRLDQQPPLLVKHNGLDNLESEAPTHVDGVVDVEREIGKTSKDEAEKCRAEEVVLLQRRREAETSARIVAAQQSAAQGLQEQKEVDDLNKLKRALVVSVSDTIHHVEN